MHHVGTLVIKTPRLILRPFRVEDAPSMYKNWASDNQVTKYLMWPAHQSVDVSRQVLQDWVTHYPQKDYYQWAIALQSNPDEPIGSISVVGQNDKTQMAHIGYCIGQNWWNQGITSEALQGVIHFLFTTVGVNRIESRHDPNNPHSGKVMLKCNMTYEGTQRQADWNNQGLCDACMYALLKKDYRPQI